MNLSEWSKRIAPFWVKLRAKHQERCRLYARGQWCRHCARYARVVETGEYDDLYDPRGITMERNKC